MEEKERSLQATILVRGEIMTSNNKTVRIFTMPQKFPCGPRSPCCGPVGQSEEDIATLKNKIADELCYNVEVIDAMDHDTVKNYYQVSQLLSSFGPMALPILTLEDEVVSIGNPTPEMAVTAIREKASQD